MDKLKNILKSDTPTEESSTGSRASGQGSHFPSRDAALTQGPERGGDSHVNTLSSGNNPTTESSRFGNSGVPTGSAATAATTAFGTQSQDRSSQGLAGHENPYRTSALDPRVDGGLRSSAQNTSSSTATGGTALAGLGRSSHQHDQPSYNTTPAPSSLTSTANPVDRSAGYSQSAENRGLDHGTSSTAAAPSYSTGTGTGTGTTDTTEQQGIVGKALGAVGLGGLAGSLGYGAAEHENNSAIADTRSQPTTTTGVDSYTAPTHQTGHSRRESIPTTAYPAGIDSPRATNAPVGGTRSSINSESQQTGRSHTGAGVGAGIGAAALGGTAGQYEHDKSQSLRENITGGSSTAPSQTTNVGSHATSGVPGDAYGESRGLRSNITSGTSATNPSTGHASSGVSSGNTSSGIGSGVTLAHNAVTVGDEAPILGSGLRDATVIGHGIYNPEANTATGVRRTSGDYGKTTSAPLTGSQGTSRETGKFTSTPLAGTHGSTQDTGKFTSAPLAGSHETSRESGKFTEAPLTASQRTTQDTGRYTSAPTQGESHTGRNVAVGAGLGASAAAAGGFAVSESSKHDYEQSQAAHQRELEKSQSAHQKELEKSEKHHQKEVEKEHKREEKLHAKEIAAHEKEEHKLQKARDDQAAHSRVAAVAPVEHGQKEKKPSIIKRIFKRRKNKDTGADEDYSTDEEDNSHKGAIGAGVVGAGVAGGAGYAAGHEHTTTSNTATAGQGFNKPSYNPLRHDDPSRTSTSAVPGRSDYTSTGASHATTGSDGRPIEPITGLPYNPSKDPTTASSLDQHRHGQGMGEATIGGPATTGTGQSFDPIAAGSFKMGEIVDTKHGHGGTATHDTGDYSSNTTSSARGLDSGYGHGTGQERIPATGSNTTSSARGLESGYGHSTGQEHIPATGSNTTSSARGLESGYGHSTGQEHIPATGTTTAEGTHLGEGGNHASVAPLVKESFQMGGL